MSSYEQNNYGPLIKQHVLNWRPNRIVEIGILNGYSTFHIAQAVRELRAYSIAFDAIDLFDYYQYKHGSMDEVKGMLEANGLGNHVNIKQGNAFESWKDYDDGSIDFMHIDISNTGDILLRLAELWLPKLSQRCMILFEGGSEERDRVDWMIKYSKTPIRAILVFNHFINDNFVHYTYDLFPSMTVLIRKLCHE